MQSTTVEHNKHNDVHEVNYAKSIEGEGNDVDMKDAEPLNANASATSTSEQQPQPPKKKRKLDKERRKFNVETKLELVREVEATSLSAVSKKYAIERQNLRLWMDTYAQLVRRLEEQPHIKPGGTLFRLHGAGRRRKCTALDKLLADRISEHLVRGDTVTRALMRDWALEFKATTASDATICPPWISRFMKLHGLSQTQSGAVVPTDPSDPAQQPKRTVISDAKKLAIVTFYERAGLDMPTTLDQFYGKIDDPKVRQVRARSILHWRMRKDDIARRAARHEAIAAATAAANPSMRGAGGSSNTIPADADATAEDDHDAYVYDDEADDRGSVISSHATASDDDDAADADADARADALAPLRSERQAPGAIERTSSLMPPSPSPSLSPALEDERRALLAKQEAFNEQKERLLVESLQCSNALKRLQLTEQNILARKRLKDAGLSQAEIDDMMPLVKFSMD